MKNSVDLLRIVFDFLGGLKEGDLEALLNKSAVLKLHKINSAGKRTYPDMSSVCKELKSIKTADEAVKHLHGLSLDKNAACGLALELGLPVASRYSKKTLLNNIADFLIQNETMDCISREKVNPNGYDTEVECGR